MKIQFLAARWQLAVIDKFQNVAPTKEQQNKRTDVLKWIDAGKKIPLAGFHKIEQEDPALAIWITAYTSDSITIDSQLM
mgnify:FL=1